MESDLWTSRLVAAKRQYSLQHHQISQSGLFLLDWFFGGKIGFFDLLDLWVFVVLVVVVDRLGMEDFEMEEDGRPDFPCPFCYEDYDIGSLCSHLEDEHPFESKVAVSGSKARSLRLI